MVDDADGTTDDGPTLSRRTMLGSAVGVGGLPVWLEFQRGSTTADHRNGRRNRAGAPGEAMLVTPPSYPDDPFLLTQFGEQYFVTPPVNGWEPVPHRERLRTIQGFHADALDWDSLVGFDEGDIRTYESQNDQLAFSFETGLPGTVGRNVTINIPDSDPVEKYQAVFDAFDWRFPDGSPVEHPNGLLAEGFDGSRHSIEYAFETNGIPSPFASGAVDLLMYVAQKRLQAGYSAFWIDGIGVFRFQGLDFSVWARDAFATHLESLSADRRRALGIDDPASFDIRAYLRGEGLAPGDDGDPFEDPVFREYLLHHHRGIKEFFAACRNRLREQFPERMDAGDVKLYGNHFMGNFGHPQAANVYTGDHFDFVHVEHFPRVDPPVDYHYKLQRAIGGFSKPATAKGTLSALGESNPGGLDPGSHYPNFKRFQVAESYAMGAQLKIPLTSGSAYSVEQTVTNWIRGDGTVPERLQSFLDFLWSHERFLDDVAPDTRVAVVWSLPTLLWSHEPQWDVGRRGDSPTVESFVGTTTLLREARIPYDVVVFGHPRLREDDQLDRLREYDAVVLPGVDSITDAQLAALEASLGEGGHVVTSGSPPTRTGMYESRGGTPSVFEHDRATVLPDDPGRTRNRDGEATGDLRDALEAAGVRSVIGRDDPTLCVSRHVQSDPDRVVVHVLNYDYDVGTDAFESKTDVTLDVPEPAFDVGAARYYSPSGSTDLSATDGGGTVTVTLPELDEWGFVVLAPSADALVDTDVERDAREQTEAVGSELAAARDQGRDWADAFVSAEVYHAAAETALDADAYGQALDAARTASEKLAEAHPRPVVGIDVAHGQPASHEGDDPFAPLREAFSQYDFRMLDAWSEDALDALDVLVVPPALAYRQAQYGFTGADLAAVESFVDGGGSLVVLARGGVAGGVDDVTEPFGFRFQGDPVVFPDGASNRVEPTHPDHLLTRGVAEMTFKLGTPIADRPSDATVLAELPDDSDAWLHTEPPLRERNSGEASAAGSVMYATASHGDGRVTLLGMHRYHLLADGYANVERVVGNQLAVLGRLAARPTPDPERSTTTATRNETASTTATPGTTATTPSTTPSESTGETPGFSFTTGALAGIAAILAQWIAHRSNDDE